MPSQSSQSPSDSSPNLKRKQPSISSFFTKKPQAAEKTSHNGFGDQRNPTNGVAKASSQEKEQHQDTTPAVDDEDDDIVVPTAKRTKRNEVRSEDETEPPAQIALPRTEKTEKTPTLNSSQRTELFRFASSPVAAPEKEETQGSDEEERERRKQREKLHKQFVQKLGGPDCLIGIGRHAVNETSLAADEAGEGDEEEEPAPAPPAKGKATAKKGASKLTPMERQVIQIKQKHMDAILVVEVGYKFRFFGEDARVAAKELNIVCIPGKFRFDERKCEDSFFLHEKLMPVSSQTPRRLTWIGLHLQVYRYTDSTFM